MFNLFKSLFGGTDNEEIKKRIDEGAFLVDVRTPMEFSQGSVKGAVNIPLDQVQSKLAKFKNHDHIIVFCRSGNRSNQAKQILAANNISNVTDGGSVNNVESLMT